MSYNYLTERFILENKDTLWMNYVIQNQQLSEELLRDLIDYFDIVVLIKNQKLTEKFIVDNIIRKKLLDDPNVDITLKDICLYQKLDYEKMKMYENW